MLNFFKKLFKRRQSGIAPYGYEKNDGMVHLRFALPVEATPHAREVARVLVTDMGFDRAHVTSMEALGRDFTSFTVLAHSQTTVQPERIAAPTISYPTLSFAELNRVVETKIGRRIHVLAVQLGGVSTEAGIDMITTMAGRAGNLGLEAYPAFVVHTLRADVSPQTVVETIRAFKADVVLVAPVLEGERSSHPPRSHLDQLLSFSKDIDAPRLTKDGMIVLCVESHLTHAQAVKLGYHTSLPPQTLPSDVASCFVNQAIFLASRSV